MFSFNNPEFGGSQKFEILIGIPPLANPMPNLPKEMDGTVKWYPNVKINHHFIFYMKILFF